MSERNRMDELFLQCTDAFWNRMDEAQRLEVLQEMENLVAAEQRRTPRPVRIYDPGEGYDPMSTNGYYNGEAIYLSPRFFTGGGKSILGISTNKGMQALTTLLHEGRHAWQREAAVGGIEGVDRKVCTLLRMNFRSYFKSEQKPALYACQPVERDARRFARDRFVQMASRALENGCEDPCIIQQLRNNDTAEQAWACEAIKTLSVEELCAHEERVAAFMRQKEPDVDLEGISMFDEVIAMIDGGRAFFRYIDGRPMGWQELTVAEVAESFDPKPDAPDDGLDPALRGLLDRLRAADSATGGVREKPDDARMRMR